MPWQWPKLAKWRIEILKCGGKVFVGAGAGRRRFHVVCTSCMVQLAVMGWGAAIHRVARASRILGMGGRSSENLGIGGRGTLGGGRGV